MKKVSTMLAVFVLLTVVLAFALQGTALAQGWQDFWDDARFHTDVWVNDDLTVDDDATIAGTLTASTNLASADLTLTDDLVVTDDARVTGTLDVAEDINVGTFLDLSSSSVVTITAGVNGVAITYTPTTSLVHLNAAAAVTVALGLVEAGRVLLVTNDDNVTMLFPDSGNQALGGARSVTQNDSLLLLSVGTGWREVAFVAN